jgi:curved DNA-binding protein CbpA
MSLTGRTQEVLSAAAAFFIEQIMLVPGADSYRVLGSVPEASPAELRTNMALLMKWLHPDVGAAAQKELYVSLVTRAWEDVKTPARRQAYDAARANAPAPVRRTPRPRRIVVGPRLKIQKASLLERAISRLLRRDRPHN